MEIEKPSFEKDLWGQCSKLHERLNKKIEYYKNLRKIFEPIHKLFTELNKKLSSMKLNMDPTISVDLYSDSKTMRSTSMDLGTKWYGVPLTMKIIKEFISITVDLNMQTLFNIVNNLERLTTRMKQEKNEYEEFQNCVNSLAENRKVMEKNMKEYHKKMWAAEQSVLNMNKIQFQQMAITDDTTIIESKDLIEEKATQLVNDAIKPFRIYEESVKKANKIREQSIVKQKHLLFTYQDIEEEIGRINTTISNIFFSNLKIQKDFIEEKKEEAENIKNNINTKKDIRQLIIEYTGNEKPEEVIPFVNFPTTIDFDKCDEDKDFNINTSTIEFIKQIINEEFPRYDRDMEEKKNDMRIITYAIFNKFSIESKNSLLDYIKIPETHNYFLILLSKLRTNNRFKQSKELIDLLGEILNIILNKAEKDKNYDNAKNCVILSQTFYYDKNNEKCYLIEKIRKHPWLLTSDFWFNFINKMISQEINKFLANHPEIKMDDILYNPEVISDKMKFKLSELLFSQLLPYVNNMVEFKLSHKTIIEITESFSQKYNYLSDEHKETIFGLISNNKEEIEKLRKEFSKNNKVLNNNKENTNNKSNNISKTPDTIPNNNINSKDKNSTSKNINNNINNNTNNKITPNSQNKNINNNKEVDNKTNINNKNDSNKNINNKINNTDDKLPRSQTLLPFNNNQNKSIFNLEPNNKPLNNEKKKESNFFKKLFNFNASKKEEKKDENKEEKKEKKEEKKENKEEKKENKKEEKKEEKKENKKEEKKEEKKENKKEEKKENKKEEKKEEKKENKKEEKKDNKKEVKPEPKMIHKKEDKPIKLESLIEKRVALLSKQQLSKPPIPKNNINNSKNTNTNNTTSNSQGAFLGVNLKKVGTIK